jgi:hypothetical protein
LKRIKSEKEEHDKQKEVMESSKNDVSYDIISQSNNSKNINLNKENPISTDFNIEDDQDDAPKEVPENDLDQQILEDFEHLS